MSSQQAVSGLPSKTHKNKKIFMGILLLVFLGMGSPFYKDAFINFYFRLTPFFQEGYAQDKALVLPYFDEVFYRRT
ncbi:MAG: hypothetical protein K0R52_1590, partial [Alphaproteobacteria bacterium]|nr:hypothetical protein [Alphaproteobacteria bacterium]